MLLVRFGSLGIAAVAIQQIAETTSFEDVQDWHLSRKHVVPRKSRGFPLPTGPGHKLLCRCAGMGRRQAHRPVTLLAPSAPSAALALELRAQGGCLTRRGQAPKSRRCPVWRSCRRKRTEGLAFGFHGFGLEATVAVLWQWGVNDTILFIR